MKKFIFVAVLTLLGIMVIVRIIDPTSPGQTVIAKSSPQEDLERAKDEMAFQRAVMGAKSLRAAMRNPESFKLASVHVKTNGAICYTYRAQNGFGGMNLESAVLAPGTQHFNQNASAWNASCAHKAGYDKTSEVNYVLGVQ